jgi:hypothetical protein
MPFVPFALMFMAYRIIRCFIFSWEFVTTLDYEWSVFRRHRPFRWTIWVGDNSHFLLGFQVEAPECEIPSERFTNLPPSVDLFRRAHSHSIGHSASISYYQRYDPIRLQGARISQLLLMRPWLDGP